MRDTPRDLKTKQVKISFNLKLLYSFGSTWVNFPKAFKVIQDRASFIQVARV